MLKTSIFGIAQDMYENEKYIGDLTETQRTTLESFVNLQRPSVSQMALALMKRDNPDYAYSELIFEPSESSSRKANPKSNLVNTEVEVLLKVFPNPANDYLTLQYRTSGYQYNKLWFAIKDVSGRTVKQQELNGGDNDELIDINELLTNVYTLILYADDRIIANEKLTILK